jgi:hypothetical protein
LVDIDKDLADMLSDRTIPWYDLLDFLKSVDPENARELYDDSSQTTVTLSTRNSGVKRHLILFNPVNNDCLLRFTLSLGTVSPRIVDDSGGDLHRSIMAKLTVPSWSQLSLDIFAVSREGLWTEEEDSQIDRVVQAMCLWIVDKVAKRHK